MLKAKRTFAPQDSTARRWAFCFSAAAILHFALAFAPAPLSLSGARSSPQSIELACEPAAAARDRNPPLDDAAEASQPTETAETPTEPPKTDREEEHRSEIRPPAPLIMPEPDALRLAYQGPRPDEHYDKAKFLSDSDAKARDRAPDNLPQGETFAEGDDPRVLFLDRRVDADEGKGGSGMAASGPSDAAAMTRSDEGRDGHAESPGAEKSGDVKAGAEAQLAAAENGAPGGGMGSRAPSPPSAADGGDEEPIVALEDLRRRLDAIPLRHPAGAADAFGDRIARRNRTLADALEEKGEGDAAGGREAGVVRGEGKKEGGKGKDEPGREELGGPGETRTGDDSVSDVITRQVSTSSGARGDPAFATLADPAAGYLRGLIARIDRNWKGLIMTERLRIRSGQVSFRYRIGADGSLLEIAETGRIAGVSDEAAALCRKAIETSFPYEKFPPDLRSPGLTVVLTFLYE